jgi:hypothetical protein
MEEKSGPIFLGNTTFKETRKDIRGEYVSLFGEPFYKIENYDAMEPFFMSIVSSSDHWLFLASSGGLTAGRISAEQALFPYYAVDKITENHENTGNKAILLVRRAQRTHLWEPFSERGWGNYTIQRNLYKNISGTAVLFEEHNLDLGLTYRYAWRTGEKYGFIKSTWLMNSGNAPCQIELLDGLQNLLPANVATATQNIFSSLLDAYKRNELDAETGLAVFALNSSLSDLAEPSESLLATTVAQVGLEKADTLLCSAQLDRFRSGLGVVTEKEIRGQRGAYFVHASIELDSKQEHGWHLMADVCQDGTAIAQKLHELRGDKALLLQEIERDLDANRRNLWQIVAQADGLQVSGKPLSTAHHFANAMFNVMRGGIFMDQYWIMREDFKGYVATHNPCLLQTNADFFAAMPEKIHLFDLRQSAETSGSLDLIRLTSAYLPLTFSRRHGDPSRPWNRFVIDIKKPDGSLKLNYEGNWRDIFQNWEALAVSYPEFVENMISTFLNATTVDGYNPYRITYQGLDWETPQPGNPWANIGYWSDHQIIYLQKLMELSTKFHPGKLQGFLARSLFSYANVPYRIKPYTDLLKDPFNTIQFDWELEHQIESRARENGTDGKLVVASDGSVLHVSLAEKLLTLVLAKLSNLVPEGGIWMNTQRPEWNDANNALVGKGLSVVTLGYLRRCLAFCSELLRNTSGTVSISVEVNGFYAQVFQILNRFLPLLQGSFTDEERRAFMDALGNAASDFRWKYYRQGLSGQVTSLPLHEIADFLKLAQQFVEHSLKANRRPDGLYHAYNILHLEEQRARLTPLYEMLEGQVSILSSGMLSGEEALRLLRSLRNSALFQPAQHSYTLYPDRKLPGFMEKNCLSEEQVRDIPLLKALVEAGDGTLVTKDVNGAYHFSGHIRNFRDVNAALTALKEQPRFVKGVEADFEKIRSLFEATFHHDEFTGRSGTFFAYEGLGSVYWHMVAKLLLAVQEIAWQNWHTPTGQYLLECYMDIRQGMGFNKSPQAYGAFPTDPYSHTPKGQGAKQPGMTGSVKELILARQAELGTFIENGQLVFDGFLLDNDELLSAPTVFSYLDVHGVCQEMELKSGSLAYSICQTPVIVETAEREGITIALANGTLQHVDGNTLDSINSRHIFLRDGAIRNITVSIPA